jgi:hypothetical protein
MPRLLGERHRCLRTQHPELPETLEDEGAARRALRDALMTWTGGGTVALSGARIAGYLVATLRSEAPLVFAGYLRFAE